MNSLFSIDNEENILPAGGKAILYSGIFSKAAADHYLKVLQQEIAWKQEPIKIFGKTILQPRLTAWYGAEGRSYSYSGITMDPLPWTASLLEIKKRIEKHTGYTFNSALLNLYRNGEDSMGWHRDNEKELGADPVIASFSLGAARVFRFRQYKEKKTIVSATLNHGNVLLMSGGTQTNWEHQLPKTRMVKDSRINITFRKIKG